MRTLRTIIVAGVTTLLALTGCSAGESKVEAGKLEKTTVKVGALPLADYAPLYWAQEKGLFSKEGLTVELQPLQGGPVGLQKTASGDLDFSISNAFSSTIAMTSGVPLTTVATASGLGDGSQIIVVKPDSPIKELKDLDGKTVGVNTTNNVGDVTFNNLAASKGIQAKPRWVEVPFNEMATGVTSGAIEAGYVPEPFASSAKAQGLRTVVDLTEGPNRGLQVAEFVASKQFVKQNPNTTAAFARAIYAAGAQMSADEAGVRAWLPGVAKLSPEVAKTMVLPHYYDSPQVQARQKTADLLQQQGILKSQYTTDKFLYQLPA